MMTLAKFGFDDLLEDEKADGDLHPELTQPKTPVMTPRKPSKITYRRSMAQSVFFLYWALWEHDL